MEGWQEDMKEKLLTNITDCYKQDGTPKNAQGILANELLNKKEHDFLIQVICPLQNLDTLIPPNIDVGKQPFKVIFDNSKYKLDNHSIKVS